MTRASSKIFILFMILVTTSCAPKTHKQNDPPYFELIIENHSYSKAKESIQVYINDVLMIRSDSCTGRVTYVPEEEQLAIKISTMDGRLPLDTLISFERFSDGINIAISYNDGSIDNNFQRRYVEDRYTKTLEYNKLNPDTIIPWLRDSCIEESEKFMKVVYPTSEPHFSISAIPINGILDCGTPLIND